MILMKTLSLFLFPMSDKHNYINPHDDNDYGHSTLDSSSINGEGNMMVHMTTEKQRNNNTDRNWDSNGAIEKAIVDMLEKRPRSMWKNANLYRNSLATKGYSIIKKEDMINGIADSICTGTNDHHIVGKQCVTDKLSSAFSAAKITTADSNYQTIFKSSININRWEAIKGEDERLYIPIETLRSTVSSLVIRAVAATFSIISAAITGYDGNLMDAAYIASLRSQGIVGLVVC